MNYIVRSLSTAPTFRYKLRNKFKMTAPEFDQALLDKLFPAPTFSSAFTSRSAPTPNAGITPESTEKLRELLKENHQRFHIFFNERGFHNHLSHHLFAAYGLGAPPSVLQAAFDEQAAFQRPAYKSPEPITRDNWTKFLGKEDFYNSYMNFFNEEMQKNGLEATFERFIFSHEANWATGEPRMFDRFLAGLVHSMIHFGHAAEFGVPGMAIEGLAQAAVHNTDYTKLFDEKFFDHPFKTSDSVNGLSTLASNLSLSSTKAKSLPRTHILTILGRVLADPRLAAGKTCTFQSQRQFSNTLDSAGDVIREYAGQWTVGTGEEEIQQKVEELTWFVTAAFGLGGWKKDRKFKADFFLVHLITSNLFLPSTPPLLKPTNQANLLKGFFAVCLATFVSRGRPALTIQSFFENTTANPKHPSLPASNEQTGNPWFSVLSATIPHKDEHHIKAERALAHGAALYGSRPRGYFKDVELEGAEYLDGTLFVRVGGLLIDTLKWDRALAVGAKNGRTKEAEEETSGWDRDGLGWE